jgi:hypothetical protein
MRQQADRRRWWRPGWFYVGLVAGVAFFYQLFAALGYIRG